MSNEFDFELEGFSKTIDIDKLIIMIMNRNSIYRVNNKVQYAAGVEDLIENSEKRIRDRAMDKLNELGLVYCNYENINEDKFRKYCILKTYVHELLEKEKRIFKGRQIRTFK